MNLTNDPEDLLSVYRGANVTEAHIVRNLLLEEGINAFVSQQNESFGGLPFAAPDVFVHRRDQPQAAEIVARYEQGRIERAERPDWTCPSCGVTVLGLHDQCDNCGAEKPQKT
jgi:hypothetical protein